MPTTPAKVFSPQPGPQEAALASPADILIYGGSAGGGKTWGLLYEPIRHADNPDFGAVIFRRTYPEIMNKGGMWDESRKVYPYLKAIPKEGDAEWTFPSKATVKFAHLQYESDLDSWTGSQIPLLCFDQLETFTERMFWYLMSRNRSTCGVKPYIRATCNPVPPEDKVGGWLPVLIAWWIDQDTGFPIPERSGVVRWFVRLNDKLIWGESWADLARQYPDLVAPDGVFDDEEKVPAKSLTFIPAKLTDNQILMKIDPGYRANLLAMPLVERERLLDGNWKVKPSAGKILNRSWFQIVEEAPRDCLWLRYWDKAGTEGGGCNSAGVRMGYSETTKLFYISSCIAGQWSAHNREKVISQTADLDGPDVEIWIEQEPGSGGKESAENTVISLPGFVVRADRVTGDKIRRAYPLSSMSEARNVKLVRGPWNEEWLEEAHRFEPESTMKDRIDATAGAYNKLAVRFRNSFGITGGGAAPPLVPVAVGENGHTQTIDPDILQSIRNSGGFGFR